MSGCIANELTSTSARGSIHGHIHWDNGRHTDFIYARIVNGEERKADFIEFDGERFERVVFCRDCKQFCEGSEVYVTYDWCRYFDCETNEDGYCAWADRRADA